MWTESLHPRDEYGRFKLSGKVGFWDRLKGGEANRAHARNIAEYEANQARQSVFVKKRDAGTLTAAEDAEWDTLGDRGNELAHKVLPKAYFRGLRPDDDGTWRRPGDTSPFDVTDAEGRRLPPMLTAGAVRVGDHPDGTGIGEGRNSRTASSQANGVWHRPGEYGPGRVPILRNDYGHRMGQLEPEKTRSRQRREYEGVFIRAEVKAEKVLGRRLRDRSDESSYRSSADEFGGHLVSALNPVGRRRTARQKRDRWQNTTWIQRLNAQMEGR